MEELIDSSLRMFDIVEALSPFSKRVLAESSQSADSPFSGKDNRSDPFVIPELEFSDPDHLGLSAHILDSNSPSKSFESSDSVEFIAPPNSFSTRESSILIDDELPIQPTPPSRHMAGLSEIVRGKRKADEIDVSSPTMQSWEFVVDDIGRRGPTSHDSLATGDRSKRHAGEGEHLKFSTSGPSSAQDEGPHFHRALDELEQQCRDAMSAIRQVQENVRSLRLLSPPTPKSTASRRFDAPAVGPSSLFGREHAGMGSRRAPQATSSTTRDNKQSDTTPYPPSITIEKTENFLDASRQLQIALDSHVAWLTNIIPKTSPVPSSELDELPFEDPPAPDKVTLLCGVCLEEHAENDIVHMDDCRHPFCKGCISSYVTSKVKERRYPILCPTCAADHTRSDAQEVSLEFATGLDIGHQELAVLEELQMSTHWTLWHCRKCMQSVFVEKEEFLQFDILICPVPGCNCLWHRPCGQEIPEDGVHECDGSSQFNDLMREEGWKYCPGCRSPVQKDPDGCNHVVCLSSGCNTHFCYLCGEEIIRSSVAREADEAVQAHYRRCTLFEAVPEQ